MKSARLLIALMAASILIIMPAFSMQDHGKEKDCCCDQNACKACHKLIAIEKAGCHGPEMGPATENAKKQFCKLCMKSMMPHDICFCKMPKMHHDGCGCGKSMMGCDGKEDKGCGCEKSMMSCDCKEDKYYDCEDGGYDCEKPIMECEGQDLKEIEFKHPMMGYN